MMLRSSARVRWMTMLAIGLCCGWFVTAFSPFRFTVAAQQAENEQGETPAAVSKPIQKQQAKAAVMAKMYDIRDLLIQPPDFNDAPEIMLDNVRTEQIIQQMSNETIVVDAPTREEMIEQIHNLIQDTIGKQEDWAAYGGEVSSLRELNANLVIRTTAANHKQIEVLLQGLRDHRSRQVATDALVLRVRTSTLEQFKKENSDGSPVLDAKAADKLAAMLVDGKSDDVQVIASVRSLAFSGQRVHTSTINTEFTPPSNNTAKFDDEWLNSDDRHLIPGVRPGSPVAPQHAPVRGTPHVPPMNENKTKPAKPAAAPESPDSPDDVVWFSGVVLDIENTLSHNAKQITMTLRCDISPISHKRVKITRPTTSRIRIRSTVMIPDRGGVLLGAGSHPIRNGKPSGEFETILFLRGRAVLPKK